ncbi:MAG: spore cortex-lytic protein [Oscillospiraceae bacterium]|nr:spore cortex-lytic protein [Oscillospiraceae bacterium]
MTGIGYLTVRISTSDAELPIEDATVTVTQNVQGGVKLLAARITDRSGVVPNIAIVTPALNESLSPGGPVPYAVVDVTVDRPGYDRALIENVQLFPGIQSQQDITLVPQSRTPEAFNMTDVVDITAQDL